MSRANTSFTVAAMSTQTTSGNTQQFVNYKHTAALVFIDVTAVSGTLPTIVFRLQALDPASGKWVDMPGALTAAIAAVGTMLLAIAPSATPIVNSVASVPLPHVWRLAWTVGGTGPSFTFSVGMHGILD